MKKIVLFSSSIVWAIFMFFSFSGEKKMAAANPVVTIVECTPDAVPVSLNAVSFKKRFGIEPLRVRKDINRLTQAELNAIKVGIIKMKALPYTDPTSWMYQANIHGTNMTDNLPSWNMCHRPGEENFFLAWHRMYVYFFERIVRAKSGRANLTIPYWNYQNNPSIPAVCRDKSLGNPLYDATRTASMNNGASLPSSIMTAYVNTLNIIPFYDFQNTLSSGPHGSVHTAVAGNMAVVTTAARDPLFWLHHSNIDRLWEVWRGRCGGRVLPVDSVWLNKSYTFFDETGTAVSLKGSDVLSIASQLNYQYDSLPPNVDCGGSSSKLISTDKVLSKTAATQVTDQMQSTTFLNESTAKLDAFITKKKRSDFKFSDKKNPERLKIIFNGITINKMPEGAVEVYLNLPPGVKNPSANSKYFVGLLDLFSAEHLANHMMPGMDVSDKISVDATQAAIDIKLKIADLKKAEVSFFVRGSSINGREITTQAKISIAKIDFLINGFQIN